MQFVVPATFPRLNSAGDIVNSLPPNEKLTVGIAEQGTANKEKISQISQRIEADQRTRVKPSTDCGSRILRTTDAAVHLLHIRWNPDDDSGARVDDSGRRTKDSPPIHAHRVHGHLPVALKAITTQSSLKDLSKSGANTNLLSHCRV